MSKRGDFELTASISWQKMEVEVRQISLPLGCACIGDFTTALRTRSTENSSLRNARRLFNMKSSMEKQSVVWREEKYFIERRYVVVAQIFTHTQRCFVVLPLFVISRTGDCPVKRLPSIPRVVISMTETTGRSNRTSLFNHHMKLLEALNPPSETLVICFVIKVHTKWHGRNVPRVRKVSKCRIGSFIPSYIIRIAANFH
jgi:hypothetical protein